MKVYKTIVIDPPWKYGRSWDGGSKKSVFDKKYKIPYPMPYPEMTLNEIEALPIPMLCDTNCDVYLWATQKYIQDVFPIGTAWGLKYCQTLTWCKTPMGTGQGGLFTPTTEFLILFRKGRMPIDKKRIDTTWFLIKRTRRHSEKPEYFQELIESVSNGPRLEMFARRKRSGWDSWGNEIENDIEIKDLI